MRLAFACSLGNKRIGGVVRAKLQITIAAVLCGLMLLTPARPVMAQSAGEQAKGDIAGTIGLGLLGAELGLILVPAVKLQDKWWAWALFPTVGAAGGAVAGVFAFDPGSPSPAVTVGILGAGLALVVPAIVGAVAWKNARDNAPAPDSVPGGVLRVENGRRTLAMPSFGVRPAYSQNELFRAGVPQRSVYEVSLVSGRF
jgi:peptidoglycan/LPS O-acetylase OafA/YrhL